MSKLCEVIENPLSGEWGLDDDTGRGCPVLRTTNFTNTGAIDYTNVVTRIIDTKRHKEKFLRFGDIIIEKSGGSPAQPVGRVVLFEGEENKYLFNNFTSVLRLKNKDNNYPKYLFYFLFSNYKQGKTRRYQNKTTGILNLKLDRFVKETEIKFPSLDRQKKIAKTLDTATELRTLRKLQLAELDNLIKSTFYDMFGDPVKNEKGWEVSCFGELSKVRQGLQIPISERKKEYRDNCYKYITVQYLNGRKEEEYIEAPRPNVICTEEDILMTRTGNTGMVITGVSGVFHNNFFLIDYDKSKLIKTYLISFLNYPSIQADLIKRATTSTIPDLNHGEFYKIAVPIPPISIQDSYSYIVAKIEEQKALVQRAIDETQILFDSLMSEYFD